MQTNPYQSPAADLTAPSSELQRSVWWKIYFFVITILTAFGFLGIFADQNAGWPEYLLLFFFLTATVGFAGFVFSKRILQPRFWLYFVALYLLISIAYYFVTQVDLSAGMTRNEYLTWSLFGWVISIPGYWGLFKYGSSSNPLWRDSAK